MNVAPATSTASRPFSFMTAHGGDTAAAGAGGRTPAQPSSDTADTEPLVNRFPIIGFSYDVDASRLVMQYRDPANGKTVSQIPTEAALKQYKEAQQQEKNAARAAVLEVTVGGSGGRPDTGGSGGGSGVSSRDGGGGAARSSLPAAAAHIASVNAAPVAHFTPSAPHRAASTGTARVNVVI
ncbi:hypothetical protein [Azospirillum doebereinerae]|uniref:Uncharacterized protein n=1 Tax=Azospirillum doebereinerae TaxID=92933 RepID=A0A3S0WNW1_9PROT|nr:hypothetical protein [Azospirillum doebereinerae]RUQ74584.1 hypothetical protein EJ913_05965 [Azospirillum doebereinerae]